jgi:tetratricopeptide (TPR) repeat protein
VPFRLDSRTGAVALLAALAVGNALLHGGTDPLAVAGSAVLGTIALALAARRSRRDSQASAPSGEVDLPSLGLALLAVPAAIALQLVPVPPVLLRVLSPTAHELATRHLTPIAAFPSWRPLSLDPGATALELAKGLGCAAVTLAAALLARSHSRRDALLRAVALGGPVVVLGIVAGRLFAELPLVEPRFPFVNPNHLAGFLQLAAWPALGFALRARGPARAGWLVAFGASVMGMFLSLSRAGITAFLVGVAIFLILLARSPAAASLAGAVRPASGRSRWAASGPPLAAALAGALAVAAFLAFDRIVGELRTVGDAASSEVKLGVFRVALQMIADFPLVGIGRGAFATAYPSYKLEPVQLTFTHVENEWLQLPLELGVPVGLGVLLLFVLAWLAAARPRRLSRPVIGALSGAAALAAQNLFDFSPELTGVAFPLAIVTGILVSETSTVSVRRSLVHLAAIGAAALASAAVVLHLSHPPEADGDRVATAATADAALAAARSVLPWHPADWVPPASVGVKLAAERRCSEAMPWLLRAIERSPTAPLPHFGAATCLARSRRDGLAKREYRLAYSYGFVEALQDALRAYPSSDAFVEIAPDTPEALLDVGTILRERRPAVAAASWRRGWETFHDARSLERLADVTLSLGSREEALYLALELQRVAPLEPGGYVTAARALDALGRAEPAIAALALGVARLPGRPPVAIPLAYRLMSQRRWSQARAICDGIAARELDDLRLKHLCVTHALEGQGRLGEALVEAQRAREVAPQDVAVLETFGRLAAASGRYDEAIRALELAASRPGADAAALAEAIMGLRAGRDQARLQSAGAPGAPQPEQEGSRGAP